MTDKPNDPSTAAGSPEPAPASRSAGAPVRSPFDNPTEQIDTSKLGKEIPRTDEDLGLDPEVPTRAQMQGGADTAETAALGAGGAAGLGGAGSAAGLGAAGGAAGMGAAGGAAGMGTAGSDTATLDAEPGTGGPDDPTSPSYAFASIPPAPPMPGGEKTGRLRRRDDRRGTLDIGLLLLRLVVGGTFIYHGLQKVTGWFHGPGLEGTRDMLEKSGWDQADIGAAMLIVSELGGGILIVVGLATPLAAGAVLATILDAWMWKQGMVPGFQYKSGESAVELESILAGAAAAIILAGPGRLSLDRNRGWATRPFLGSVAALVAAVAAAIATWLWLHGGNPLTGVGPFD
ncbi:DoxX family protein [Nocardia sp. NPDC050406]|uniref:DoxX family protein n=1 Tax=Nocardia sp. NPDC050406 TaxID=3364318 RepID=UPI00378A523A